MIIVESGDSNKWSIAAQCTETIHQPQAAGVLFQRGLMEKMVWNLFSASLLCLFYTAGLQHVTARVIEVIEESGLRATLHTHRPIGAAATCGIC